MYQGSLLLHTSSKSEEDSDLNEDQREHSTIAKDEENPLMIDTQQPPNMSFSPRHLMLAQAYLQAQLSINNAKEGQEEEGDKQPIVKVKPDHILKESPRENVLSISEGPSENMYKIGVQGYLNHSRRMALRDQPSRIQQQEKRTNRVPQVTKQYIVTMKNKTLHRQHNCWKVP